jgi:hypothetical protein
MFPGSRLQLAFQQLLQVRQAAGLIEQALQGAGLPQQGSRRFGGMRTKGHAGCGWLGGASS